MNSEIHTQLKDAVGRKETPIRLPSSHAKNKKRLELRPHSSDLDSFGTSYAPQYSGRRPQV